MHGIWIHHGYDEPRLIGPSTVPGFTLQVKDIASLARRDRGFGMGCGGDRGSRESRRRWPGKMLIQVVGDPK